MGPPVIELCDVSYSYPDGTVALRGVDLSVRAGERVAIVGSNGSGKSSLLSVAGGLADPAAGRVRFFDATEDPEAVRDRVGVLLQNPDDYLFNGSVREDILYGPAQFGVDPDRATRRLADLADRLALEDLLDRAPFQLSGGEKQRAALACVLSFEPDVLLLDEPVSSVDRQNQRRMLEVLTQYRCRHDATVVVATPDLSLVPSMADRTVLLDDGRVAADGRTRAVLTDAGQLREHGLRTPPIVELFDRLGDPDPPLSVDEAVARLSDTASPADDADG
jgi:cobalt/nickel transport system ATP-binding protein